MKDCEDVFDHLKKEYSERGLPFRWCWLDATEQFEEGSVYIVKKTARKSCEDEAYPRQRIYFNNLFVADKEELISYAAFNLAKSSGRLPDPIHARMVFGNKNIWSQMYFELLKS